MKHTLLRHDFLRPNSPDFTQVRSLRQRVLGDPKSLEEQERLAFGDFLEDTLHPAIFLGNRLLAVARVDRVVKTSEKLATLNARKVPIPIRDDSRLDEASDWKTL